MMLNLIKGRAASGKTALLRNKILQTINGNESRPLLIVPEQFSFETEKSMLRLLGAEKLKKIDIFSFSRLSFSYLKSTDALSRSIPDNGVRSAIMSEALVQSEGRLDIFSSCKSNTNALSSLVELCKELDYCCIDSDELEEKAELLGECYLKEKLSEINIIKNAYDALVTQSYFNDTEAVKFLSELAVKERIFENRTIFIDGFRAFSKQEIECFIAMISQANDVYITLCADEIYKKFSPFEFIKKFEHQLRSVAAENNIRVSEIFCIQSENVFPEGIFALEKNIYSGKKLASAKNDGSVIVAECVDKDDEVCFVASKIKNLIRSGKYRCRDIAVIERTNGTYKNALIAEFRRLDVPVFDDSRRSLSFETLFVYINSVLNCISSGFSSESVFTYLKTGLSSLSLAEIARLEKYALVWGINGSTWLNDFSMHPDGFGNDFNDSAAVRLVGINELRRKAISPLVKLKKNCIDKDGKGISECVYDFLIEEKIPEKLFELYKSLYEGGFPIEAERQAVSWDILMNILNVIAILGEEKYSGLSRWVEIFTILVDSGDVGEIPQGLDEVRVGSADRIRTEQMKVVFLVGANKDEFPLVNVKNGILTDADRVSLTSLGLEIRPPFESVVDEEYFIVYCAVTAANEKLYITYKTLADDGSQAFPSEIVEKALDSVEGLKPVVTSETDPMLFVGSEEGAFTLLARNYNVDSPLTSSLLSYFSDKKEYNGKLDALQKSNSNKPFVFKNEEISRQLFGQELHLSASRIENFYNCPFAYFMRHGLKAEPLRVAELDPAQSGTILHIIMETILKKYNNEEFLESSSDELRNDVTDILSDYLNEKMGGVENKSKRFIFLFERLVDISMTIINRLKVEFSVGAFKPCDFELKIGGDEIPSYNLPLDSGNITINGSVDRVDMMEKDEVKYIRVVDYKTGKKEFRLSDVLDGLNIQMLLYLIALEKNGKNYYGEIVPAGVLYLPSRIGISNYLDRRAPSAENIEAQKRVSGKLSGMVLDSPVVFNGMGVDRNPDYYPVRYKKDGSPYGNYYSLNNFKKLTKIIDGKIINMGNALHNGKIGALPIGENGEGKMCKYCSYRSVCGYESGDPISELSALRHAQALKVLEVDSDE